MNSVTVENFRCFGDKRTVRLAPLTLLVGENSTGKTSFLALIRALWDMVYDSRIPDFRETPWDLGSFDEVAHHRGSRGGRASAIKVGFGLPRNRTTMGGATEFSFELANDRTSPTPNKRRLDGGQVWISEEIPPLLPYSLTVGTARGKWRFRHPVEIGSGMDGYIANPTWYVFSDPNRFGVSDYDPTDGESKMRKDDLAAIQRLSRSPVFALRKRPFASAPVRSKPLRTYDPSRIFPDPEGDYIPTYLADVRLRDPDTWQYLKSMLEAFGSLGGLFDQIEVKHLGGYGSPFQIRVKKHDGRYKGPWRNIVDVGYGVSQALPVFIELVRPDSPDMFLLQQPEVHLHPMAQAALGSIFCAVAGTKKPRRRKLIVETHSDHLINRVRMDVRDEVTDLRPEDVMVLYFERVGLDVKIHEVTFDSEGNVDAPEGYRGFFRTERERSIWGPLGK